MTGPGVEYQGLPSTCIHCKSFGHGSEECIFNKPAKIQEDILQVGGCKKESEGKRVEVDPFGEQGKWTVVGKRKVLGQDKRFLGPNRVKRHDEGGEFQGVKQGNSQTYRGRFVHQPDIRHRAPSHRCSVVDHPILQPVPSVPPRSPAALASARSHWSARLLKPRCSGKQLKARVAEL
ncbi:hypothetical protein U1Q18_014493 [Sarracenia purpurea var. burkii]